MITIVSKEGCKLCQDAADLLSKEMVDYEFKKDYEPKGQYPKILVDGLNIGSFFELEEYIQEEPILTEGKNRYTVFPLMYPNLWELYKKAQMSNWTAEEIDLNKDLEDWTILTEDEKKFIKYVLAFFASSDGIVFENINLNFAKEVQLAEARSFYAYQAHNEMVHGETYSLLIEKYIWDDHTEKMRMFNAIDTVPCIGNKAKWALKWFDTNKQPFRNRLVAFACVEGIFFSGSFCAIFWLKKRGLMPGLSFSNELISRDEALHQEFAVELFHMLKIKPGESIVHSIVSEAVSIEKEFITEAIPCKLIGMDSEKMSLYIEYVADRMLKQLGYSPIWNSLNPFDFMENISLDGKTNFFEKRVGDYGKLTDISEKINLNEEF